MSYGFGKQVKHDPEFDAIFGTEQGLNDSAKKAEEIKERYLVEDQSMRDARIIEARMYGFEIIYGDDLHLLLDIDSPELSGHFYEILQMLYDRFGAEVEQSWNSKNGNWHLVISIAYRLPMPDRIALQAMLGSDPRKEMMALCSYHGGVDNPIILFKPGMKLLPRPK